MGENEKTGSIGYIKAWALAAGGMVGGGIYVSLGVVIEAAGQYAWLSFLIAGIAAILSAYSYAALTNKYTKSGGVFDFLEEIGHKNMGGLISWLLAFGYILTISVYAYAFGNYLSYAFGTQGITTRAFIASILITFTLLNLSGVSKLTKVEVVIVAANLLVLLALGVSGLFDWNPYQLSSNIETRSVGASIFGAAAIFVAYEGFQLLTYEYDEMKNPKAWFVPVLTSAACFVVISYILVTLGTTMIAGAGGITSHTGVSLSYAAQQKFGFPGLVGLTIAAGFATSAAINSTLFSTAKLMKRIAREHELPKWFNHTNKNDIPSNAIILIACCAGSLAMLGSLSQLVEAASLVFITVFIIVNSLAFLKVDSLGRYLGALGALMSLLIMVFLIIRLWNNSPLSLCMIAITAFVLAGVHAYLRKKTSKVE